MRVEQLMHQPVVTCSTADAAHAAAQKMWEHDCGVIPVTDADGRLAGVVTDRDICMAAWSTGQPLAGIPVASVMAKSVVTCRAGDTLEAAERVMAEKQVRRLPVVDDDNKPIGVLSLNDVTRYATMVPKPNGAKDDALKTLAAVCQARPSQGVAA